MSELQEKRELQEDGHYQVSLYDTEKQKLTHRWFETQDGKKDGEEIEYFEDSDKVKRKANWKNGKKNGGEEIYEMVDVVHGKHRHAERYKRSTTKFYDTFDIQKERRLVERNFFISGEISLSEKIFYPKEFDNNTSKILAETAFIKIGCLDISAFNIVVVKDGLTDDIKQISFDREVYETGDGFSGALYRYERAYDMNFKAGKEYNGSYDFGEDYDGNTCSYHVKQGKLTGNFQSSGKKVYYENGLKVRASYRGVGFETWSYNEAGQLNGLNIAKNDRGQIVKECTHKHGKLDGRYFEAQEYINKRTIKCTYIEDKLEGEYFEEANDTKIECSYKEGKLDGKYKKYKKDEQGSFVLYKECSFKDGVLDGDYTETRERIIPHEAYRNGIKEKIEIKCQYKNGELDGIYEEVKQPAEDVEYQYRYKYKNTFEYKDGVLDGVYINEEERVSTHYKEGKLDGKYVKFSSKNNQKETEKEYKDGKLNGICIEYDEYGFKTVESTYKNDVLDGPYTEYFRNGKPKCEGSYSNGEKNGFWKTYADNGDLIEMRRFENDKDVTERYNKLKKIASKRIEKEKAIEAETGVKTRLPKMSKGAKVVAMVKESLGLSK